ncbi:MAG TPA: GDSL-type esterase/lipase family protein [Sphingomonas sp.]|nr:GDSL-type esterase/lipase family protein [Sphingomonas sp.]
MRLAALAALLLASGEACAQPAPATAAGAHAASLDGTELICPPLANDTPEMIRMRENALRPDPNFKMDLPPGGFQGEAFKKFMAALAERQSKDWPYLCRYRAANAELLAGGSRPDMILMGDSITENWVSAHPDFFAHGFVGRGISGQSSPQMLARFYADVVALHPRFVHIMAGTNDIGGATGPSLEQDYINNINAMIDIAQANGITVILAAIPPITKILPRPDFDPRPNVRRINADLKSIAERRNLVFVDYFRPLADASGAFDHRYANEGVHPNRDGYSIMEPLLLKAYETAGGKIRR